jgi:hypothetical protein
MIINSTVSLGNSRYIVGQGGSSTFQTIGAAIVAAEATHEATTIYIQPGVYNENLTFPTSLTSLVFIGTSAGTGFFDVIINGNHTFYPTGDCNLVFQDLYFHSALGDTFTFGSSLFPINYNTNIDFSSCKVVADNGNAITSFGTGVATTHNISGDDCFFLASSVALNMNGTIQATLHNCRAQALIYSLFLGLYNTYSPSIDAYLCTFDSTVTGGVCVFIEQGIVTSSYNAYYAGAHNSGAAFYFAGPAGGLLLVDSMYDSFLVQDSSYYAKSAGPFGSLLYSFSTFLGGVTDVDPQIIQTFFQEAPIPVPTLNGELPIGSSLGKPIAATLTAGTGVSIVNGPGSITVSSHGTSGGLVWQTINSNTALVSNYGYIVIGGALSLTLPVAPVMGDVISVVLATGGTSWVISLSGGQQIRIGAGLAVNSVTTSSVGDALTMVCISGGAGSQWICYSTIGGLFLS